VTPKLPTPVEVVHEAIPSTDELTVLFEKRYEKIGLDLILIEYF
jgi:hypothetical protein